MRKLNYLVLGFTPMFTAVAFAQVLNTGIKERMIVQAQAGGQMGGQGQVGRDPMDKGGMEPMNEGKSNDPMASDKDKNKHRGAYPMRGRGKSDTMRESSTQTRKGKMEETKPSGE